MLVSLIIGAKTKIYGTKNMIKKPTFCIVMALFFAVLTGCSANTSEEKVNMKNPNNSNNPGNEKPQAVLPITNFSNWKDQMWIEWLVTNKTTNSQKCRRMLFNSSTTPGNDNLVIQSAKLNSQKKCMTYDSNVLSIIYFDSVTFKITLAEACVDFSMNKCKDITNELKDFNFIVNSLKDSFSGLPADIKWSDKNLPLIKNISNQIFYLNQPSSPFHAFAIQWENQNEKTSLINLSEL